MRETSSPARGIARLVGFIVLNMVMIVVYVLCLGPARRWRRPVQVIWSKACYRLAGIRVRTFGERYTAGPALSVANHVSYLDIPILAALIDAAFVAKSEVAAWPLVGTAAKVTGTVFIKRSGGEAAKQQRALARRLAAGRGLILFAEGTSTDGRAVAPFKSALFSIAETPPPGGAIVVQPVSIAYPRDLDGRPLTGARRAHYCWFGAASLVPHMLRMMRLKGAEAEVRFHPPIRVDRPVRRKDLARQTHMAVAQGVGEAFAELARRVPSSSIALS